MPSFSAALAAAFLLPALVVGQLSGTVGPLTSSSAKAKVKTCSVLDYGGVADGTTDIGPALTAAFTACKAGGVVQIPSGDYAIETWVTLSGGSAWALQLDGIISRTGTDAGNMIMIEHATDFELFSSTSAGAVQGNGYIFHAEGDMSGPRILRLYEVTDFSVHDVALVDAPMFHFSMDTCTNGEVYNMAIRGGDEGGLDGIDVWSNNIHIHDVMVTNKDECVTVKSPATNILVEDIYCNWSGGCAIGSLGVDTAISNILYRNIYSWTCNEMMMIKSNGGSGTVSNVTFENFIGHGNAYSLDIDQYWSSMTALAGDGVQLSDITISNWTGTEADGAERGPIKVVCADGAPCTGITITDFNMWTEEGSTEVNTCRSAFGEGGCLEDGTVSSYAAVTTTIKTAPTGYSAPSMAADLATAFGTTVSIPIPTIPTSFFPGNTPLSPLAKDASASATSVAAVVSVTSASSTSKSSSSAVATSSVVVSAEQYSASATSAVVSSVATSSVVSAVETSSIAKSSVASTSAELSSVVATSSTASATSTAKAYTTFATLPHRHSHKAYATASAVVADRSSDEACDVAYA